MKIELIGKRVVNLTLNQIDGDKKAEKSTAAKVTLDSQLFANVKDTKLFRVKYHSITTIEARLQVELTYEFDFKSNEDFSEETAKSYEVISLVPSMAYPYIKTYVEQVLVMSNLGSFQLPYFDFFDTETVQGKA